MTRYDIDYSRYDEIVSKIDFNPKMCSDGLCCFLTKEHIQTFHVLPSQTLGLVQAEEPKRANNLWDLVKKMHVKDFYENRACNHLFAKPDIHDDRLTLQFRCELYLGKRPSSECYDYPREEEGGCAFHKYRHALDNFDIKFLYSFSKKEFPQLEEFSCGTSDSLWYGESFLVPVPLFSKVPEIFTPLDVRE